MWNIDYVFWLIQQSVANKETSRVDIFLEDLEEYFNSEKDRQIVEAIKKNTLRFVEILS